MVHIDNLAVLLHRRGLHAPNHIPQDGLIYRSIHQVDIQSDRAHKQIPVGPRGAMLDYVPFYLGARSPMLFRLKTGTVPSFQENQDRIVYLVSAAQKIHGNGLPFVFSDGHGLTRLTEWFDELARLDGLDWETINSRFWKNQLNDNDRQRRKQAEFLVHRFCPWPLIEEIGVRNSRTKDEAEKILSSRQEVHCPIVRVRPNWYY